MHTESAPLHQADIARRYAQVRAQTRHLIEGQSAEYCALQSMPDAGPLKWHLAHTTWFFETFVLERFARDHTPFHPAYRYRYNSYYNTIGEQYPRARRGLLSCPALEGILRYRAQVNARMTVLLTTQALTVDAASILALGLHHEQQHQRFSGLRLMMVLLKSATTAQALHSITNHRATSSMLPRLNRQIAR